MYFFEKNTYGEARLKLVAVVMASHVWTNASSGKKSFPPAPPRSQRPPFMTSCSR